MRISGSAISPSARRCRIWLSMPTNSSSNNTSLTMARVLALVPALSKRLPDTTEMQSADPDTQRERLFNAVVGLLAAAAADHGLSAGGR